MLDEFIKTKVLLVGDGASGKTSLVRKLINSKAKLPSIGERTKGVDRTIWDWSEESTNYRVSFWDFGGQERYYSVHNLFMSDNSIYILVWDPSKQQRGFNYEFNYWLNLIRHFGGNSPIIVVVNKTDLFPEKHSYSLDTNSRELNNVVSINYASCLTCDGLAEIKETIKKTVMEISSNSSLLCLRKEWLGLKKEISELIKSGKKYIRVLDYLKLCKQKFNLDDQTAFQILDTFNAIGEVIHLKNYDALKELIIIDPNWILDNIYQILDYPKAQNYKFTQKDVEEVLINLNYADTLHLFSIMNEVGLCFNCGDSYIVPSLLVNERPREVNWDSKNPLRMIYKYHFIRESFFGSLLAKLHEYHEDGLFWRNGTIIKYEDEKAYICFDIISMQIKIYTETVRCTKIIEKIREKINELHNEWNGIQYEEFIVCCCEHCQNAEERNKDIVSVEYIIKKAQHKKIDDFIECRKGACDVPISNYLRGIDTNSTTA